MSESQRQKADMKDRGKKDGLKVIGTDFGNHLCWRNYKQFQRFRFNYTLNHH